MVHEDAHRRPVDDDQLAHPPLGEHVGHEVLWGGGVGRRGERLHADEPSASCTCIEISCIVRAPEGPLEVSAVRPRPSAPTSIRRGTAPSMPPSGFPPPPPPAPPPPKNEPPPPLLLLLPLSEAAALLEEDSDASPPLAARFSAPLSALLLLLLLLLLPPLLAGRLADPAFGKKLSNALGGLGGSEHRRRAEQRRPAPPLARSGRAHRAAR